MMGLLSGKFGPFFMIFGAAFMAIYLGPKVIAKIRGAQISVRTLVRANQKHYLASNATGSCGKRHPIFGACQQCIFARRITLLMHAVAYCIPTGIAYVVAPTEGYKTLFVILTLPLLWIALIYVTKTWTRLCLFEYGVHIRGVLWSRSISYADIESIEFTHRGAAPISFTWLENFEKKVYGSAWKDHYVILTISGGKQIYLKASQYKELFTHMRDLQLLWSEADDQNKKIDDDMTAQADREASSSTEDKE